MATATRWRSVGGLELSTGFPVESDDEDEPERGDGWLEYCGTNEMLGRTDELCNDYDETPF